MNQVNFIKEYILKSGACARDYSSPISSSHYIGFYEACKKYNLDIIKIGLHYLVSDQRGVVVGSVKDMKSNFVSLTASSICNDKSVTFFILGRASIPVPKQVVVNSQAKIEEFEGVVSYPVVLKPLDGKGGESVFVNVDSKAALFDLFEKHVKAGKPSKKWVVEEFLDGFDVRVVVINGRFSCACVRIPPFVVGDGVSSVKALADEKNLIRARHPHHKRFLISVPETLSDYVPGDREVFLISSIPNIHQGGEAFDVTDIIHDDLKRLAEDAVKAIPGLNCAGVDLIASSLESREGAFVIELNTASNYEIHYYPYYGSSRNPAADIVLDMVKKSAGDLKAEASC